MAFLDIIVKIEKIA